MDLNARNIVEYIKYVTYPRSTAMVILANDTLNLHIRESNVESYVRTDHGSQSRLTLTLNSNLKDDLYGVGYNGRVRVVYDRIDAGIVFPNGFYTNEPIIDLASLKSTLDLLRSRTRIIIDVDECRLVTVGGQTRLEFLDSSVFWKGSIRLRDLGDVVYDHSIIDAQLDSILTTSRLNGPNLPGLKQIVLGADTPKEWLDGFNQD